MLYPNCEDGNRKLGTTVELLQWKEENGLSDKGFETLLKIWRKKLPKDNEFPASTYKAKKVVCPLGLEVQKIHACISYLGMPIRETRVLIRDRAPLVSGVRSKAEPWRA